MLANHFVIKLKKPIENYRSYREFAKDIQVNQEQRKHAQYLYGELQNAENVCIIDNNYNELTNIRIIPIGKLHWADANDIEAKVNKYARQLLAKALGRKVFNTYAISKRCLDEEVKNFLRGLSNVTELNNRCEVVINENS